MDKQGGRREEIQTSGNRSNIVKDTCRRLVKEIIREWHHNMGGGKGGAKRIYYWSLPLHLKYLTFLKKKKTTNTYYKFTVLLNKLCIETKIGKINKEKKK